MSERPGFHSSVVTGLDNISHGQVEISKLKVPQIPSSEVFKAKDNWVLDTNYRLHYVSTEGEVNILNPLEPITDSDLILGVMGNSELKSTNLTIRERDREKIWVTNPETSDSDALELQGKSGIMIFEHDKSCSGIELMGKVVKSLLRRMTNKRDHLYCASVAHIASAGWAVYWAPLQWEGKVLHARLVAGTTIATGGDPTEEEINSLVKVFSKVC